MLDLFHFQNLMAYIPNFAPPPHKKMLTVSGVESKAHNVTHTHTHTVDLLPKFIQI